MATYLAKVYVSSNGGGYGSMYPGISVQPATTATTWFSGYQVQNTVSAQNSLVYLQGGVGNNNNYVDLSSVTCQRADNVMNNSRAGLQFFKTNRLLSKITSSAGGIYNYQNVKYAICETDIFPDRFQNFNADTFPILLIPAGYPGWVTQTPDLVKQNLLTNGFKAKNVLGAYQQQVVDTYISSVYPVQQTQTLQLTNCALSVKYSEFPAQIIRKYYVNNEYLETIITESGKVNEIYNNVWNWIKLETPTQLLKFTIKEFYYDGKNVIQKDDEDVFYNETNMKLYVK